MRRRPILSIAPIVSLLSFGTPLAGGCGDDDGASDPDASSSSGTTTAAPTSESTGPSTSVGPDTGTATTADTSSGATTGTTGDDATLLERVVTALGGAGALDGLVGFELEVSGTRMILDESEDPAQPLVPASDYDATIAVDIDDAGMRLDIERVVTFLGLGLPVAYSEIVSGQLGLVTGTNNIFMLPPGPMLSDQWSSTVRQQRFSNPHMMIQEAVADPGIATEAGAADYDGRPHELLELAGGVRPITLWVDSETDLISRLTTTENDWLRRDTMVEVVFDDWQPSDGGVLFPNQVTSLVDGFVIGEETRADVTTTLELPAEMFEIPADAGATYVEADGARGERNHAILQQFAAAGLPFFGLATFVSPAELAEGVWYLTGVNYNSLVVEQAGGVVLVETPIYEARCLAVLEWIDANLPGQLVTHAVVTHHHVDHAACARTLVARGATLVVGEGSDVLWTDILTAPSTVEPDELEMNPVADPLIEYVPDGGSFTIDDATRPVTVYDLPNEHALDMVLPFVENGGIAVTADLYSTGGVPQVHPPASQQAILDVMEQNGILGVVNIIAGVHGFGPSTLADLQAAAGG